MNGFEKMLKIMRDEASHGVETESCGLAIVTEKGLSYNGLELEEEDVIISELLTMPLLTKLDITIESSGGDSHTHGVKDNSEYTKPLKEGDVVFGFMVTVDDDEKFLALTKVDGGES